MSESCKSCKFFQPTYESGRCRRNPPAVIATSNGVDYVHPVRSATDWCGEYQEKPEKRGG